MILDGLINFKFPRSLCASSQASVLSGASLFIVQLATLLQTLLAVSTTDASTHGVSGAEHVGSSPAPGSFGEAVGPSEPGTT